jgi:hypothetical protein
VTAVAVGDLDGNPVVVSGAHDGTVVALPLPWRDSAPADSLAPRRIDLSDPVRAVALHGSVVVVASDLGIVAIALGRRTLDGRG